jgi:IS6 family transposase
LPEAPWDRGHFGDAQPPPSVLAVPSAFAGFRFPPDVILLAVRWYLRFGLSYRDVEELLAERGVEVDHVSVYRWVQRFTPLLVEGARPARHASATAARRRDVLKISGTWQYLYRAVDQFGQVIDVFLSAERDARAARLFFARAIASTHTEPVEVITDRAGAYPGVLDELLPGALHDVGQYANYRLEADHGRLKARLRPMRGLKTAATTWRICLGHSFIQNLRRGHHELGVEVRVQQRLAAAFTELAVVI